MTAPTAEPSADGQTPLTPAFCARIVVRASPQPGHFTDVTQLLHELGVIDAPRAAFHRIRIGELMADAGHPIGDLSTIQSGPAIDVATCRDSVFANAS